MNKLTVAKWTEKTKKARIDLAIELGEVPPDVARNDKVRNKIAMRESYGWLVCKTEKHFLMLPKELVPIVEEFLDKYPNASYREENGCVIFDAGTALLAKKLERV